MHKRIVLKTLSSVHIGGNMQEITPLEAVVSEGCCYVVDESRMGRALLEENMLDRLYQEIDRQGRNFKLDSFLRQVKLLNKSFLDKSAAYCSTTALRYTPSRLRPFVRDAFSCPFIPGSSIKGVLRTAIMYGVLKRMKSERPQDFKHLLINEVRNKLREFSSAEQWKQKKPWFMDKTKQNMAGAVERKLMQNFQLPLPSDSRRGPTSQQRDIMRTIKVSDSSPLDKNSLSLQEVQVLSLTRSNETYLKTPIFVETLPPGVEMEFSITFDEDILGDFSKKAANSLPFNSLEEVLSCLHEFSTDLWEFERVYWDNVFGPGTMEMREFYRQKQASKQALMRLGWGSGLAGASLLMLLPADLRREIRDTLFEPRGEFEFPKSRRAVLEGDTPLRPLGWLSLAVN